MRTSYVSVIVLCMVLTVCAEVPPLINYQGRLLDGTNLVNGSVALSLQLYDDASAGALLYEDSNQVAVVDGLYSTLIGDDTVNTLPEDTIAAFEDHGTLARTVDIDADAAQQVIDDLEAVGIDLEDVGRTLETEGVDKFNASFEHLIGSLDTKAQALAAS